MNGSSLQDIVFMVMMKMEAIFITFGNYLVLHEQVRFNKVYMNFIKQINATGTYLILNIMIIFYYYLGLVWLDAKVRHLGNNIDI